jgi:hypothetical protein
MDVSGNRDAVNWARSVLQEAPPQAVLLTGQDAHTFALWYAHEALGERPDVVVLDRDLWGQQAYREAVAGVLGCIDGDLSAEEAAQSVGRPVFRVEDLLSEEP